MCVRSAHYAGGGDDERRPSDAVFATTRRDDDFGRFGFAGRLRERRQPDARPRYGASRMEQ